MAKTMCRFQVDRLEETRFGLVNKSRNAGASEGRYPIRFNRLYNRVIKEDTIQYNTNHGCCCRFHLTECSAGSYRGECSKMPRVSKMPTPLKTYSKFQIRIFVVSLHVATSWEPSYPVTFRNSRYYRD